MRLVFKGDVSDLINILYFVPKELMKKYKKLHERNKFSILGLLLVVVNYVEY